MIKRSEKEKLREGNVARSELFAEAENEAPLHLENDKRQLLHFRSKLGGGYRRVRRDC